MKNRAIRIVACILVLTALLIVSGSAADTYGITSFSDVAADYWGYDTIMDMTERGLFKGTTEPINGVGTFSPEKTMTRAEFVTVAMRAVCPEEAGTIDTKGEQWWKGFYFLALETGILKAGELDNGDLSQPMSREEMAMVMVRCVEIIGELLSERVEISRISDYYTISVYYRDYVRDCFSFGLLCGVDEAGTFAPAKALTRAEVVTVLNRLLDKSARVNVEIEIEVEAEDSVVPEEEIEEDEKLPWEEAGAKQPGDYTWEDYLALPDEEKDSFFESFESVDAFDKWLNKVNGGSTSGGSTAGDSSDIQSGIAGNKKPEDYSWEEYLALPDEQKDAFFESFGSTEAFDEWLEKARGEAGEYPWENGEKQPKDYTWEEYLALPDEQKDAFFESFESLEEFDKWLTKNQP